MNRDDHLSRIAKNFGRLANEIRMLNAIGRFDINTVAEDFFIPIVKVAFQCPNLENQNTIKMNFPAVDLGCRNSRVSFQITTDASSSKAEKTLQKFKEHKLEKIFDKVYILALAEKQSSYNATALVCAIAELNIPFDPDQHIIDIRGLISQIRGLDTKDLESIDNYLASAWVERDQHVRFREQLDKFLEFSTSKIEYEKRSRKYIPSIFVETHSTKEEMRLFANPLFFYRKIQDELARFDYKHFNSLMKIAKEPLLLNDIDGAALNEKSTNFAELDVWLKRVEQMIAHEFAKVHPVSWDRDKNETPLRPVNGPSTRWEIVRFPAESSASGLISRLKDARGLIELIRKKIWG